METTLFYFSGTGNSLALARQLAREIDDCQVVSIASCIDNEIVSAETERVGFVFPLYYYGLPLIVEKFLNKVNLDSARYIFFIETQGGNSPVGYVYTKISRILKKKGKLLSAGFKILMPNNYIKKDYDIDSESEIQDKLIAAKIRISAIAEIVKSNQRSIDKDSKISLGFAWACHSIWKRNVHRSDVHFHADSKCNSCGLCERICPVNNIILDISGPNWKRKCEECLACINFCPKQSIQYSTATERKGRYHHPENYPRKAGV